MSYNVFIQSQMFQRKSKNLTKLGFNFDSDPKKEYLKIQALLYSEYHIKCESMLTIMKKFSIPSSRTMDLLFSHFDIESRSLSDAVSNAISQDRLVIGDSIVFIQKWHTTWDNKQVYLRSSYEINYAQSLDKKQIKYEVECMRIRYFSPTKQKYRIAIPDFYLPETNTIVEIKSSYWLDLDEMKSKFIAYKDLGFTSKLIMDDIEYEDLNGVPGGIRTHDPQLKRMEL